MKDNKLYFITENQLEQFMSLIKDNANSISESLNSIEVCDDCDDIYSWKAIDIVDSSNATLGNIDNIISDIHYNQCLDNIELIGDNDRLKQYKLWYK